VIIPLVLACILNSKIRGSEFFKTAYFLPFITPMIVNASIVRDCIDEMEYSDIGNQVIKSIVYNQQD
jgi:ABC-type sugar transport system permease subunit